MRDFKKYISQKAAKDLGIESTTIWMTRYDRLVILSEKVLQTKLNYIHNNPVKDGLIAVPEGWLWSSAISYMKDENGRIPVFKNWF